MKSLSNFKNAKVEDYSVSMNISSYQLRRFYSNHYKSDSKLSFAYQLEKEIYNVMKEAFELHSKDIALVSFKFMNHKTIRFL